jgi:hypothetical protein
VDLNFDVDKAGQHRVIKLCKTVVLSPFQIICRFAFPRRVPFVMHLNIYLCLNT